MKKLLIALLTGLLMAMPLQAHAFSFDINGFLKAALVEVGTQVLASAGRNAFHSETIDEEKANHEHAQKLERDAAMIVQTFDDIARSYPENDRPQIIEALRERFAQLYTQHPNVSERLMIIRAEMTPMTN